MIRCLSERRIYRRFWKCFLEIYGSSKTAEVAKEYGVKIIREFDKIEDKKYDAVVLCVAHSEFKEIDLKSITYENSTIYDVKSAFDRNIVTQRL